MENKSKKKKKRQRGDESQIQSPTREDSKKVKIQQDPSVIQKGLEETQNITIKAVKPIITEIGLIKVREVCKSLKLSGKPVFKVMSNNSTQIMCNVLSDKKIIMEALRERLINYFTYSEPSEKPTSFVLKGFYEIDPEELLTVLKANGIPAIKAFLMFKNSAHCLYVINFKNTSMSFNMLNHLHRVVDDVAVKWELYKNKSKVPSQCHRCQRWGHTTSGCGYQYRCVKCIMNHPIGECSRTTKEGSPQCCNCRGNHAANHRGCEAYKAYEKMVTKQKTANSQKRTIVQRRLQEVDFPVLDKSSKQTSPQLITPCNSTVTPTYAQQLKSQSQVSASHVRESQSQFLMTGLTDLTSHLLDSPNIQIVLRLLQVLVDQLRLISEEREHVSHTAQSDSNSLITNNDGL